MLGALGIGAHQQQLHMARCASWSGLCRSHEIVALDLGPGLKAARSEPALGSEYPGTDLLAVSIFGR